MIEHFPWVGPLYNVEGIGGQRLGIMGYSAWTDDDHADFTVESISNVISGKWPKVQFFNSIPKYFGMGKEDFYNRVVFFEFVPCSIGGGGERYAVATPDQAAAGRGRVLRIVREQSLDKLLVFSAKAWSALPPGDLNADQKMRLGDTNFEVREYQLAHRHLTAIGLRHTQYAPGKIMRYAVEQALALPIQK